MTKVLITCSSCQQEKPEEDFYFKNSARGIRHARCKVCAKASSKQHYRRNRKTVIQKNVARQAKQYTVDKSWIESLQLACTQCGEDHPAVLDFHHTDPTTKEFTVSKMMGKYSRRRIEKEITKCVVLCSNCHRKHHWVERQCSKN